MPDRTDRTDGARALPVSGVLGVAAALLLAACGGEPEAAMPVERESAEDQVLRVGKWWESQVEERGFRGAPSAITVFERRVKSTIVFELGQRAASETLQFDETYKTTSGATYRCQQETKVKVAVAFGAHTDTAAVQMSRPALRLSRRCEPAGFPEPALELPATVARFMLRGDQLVAFAPTSESRIYLPIQ